ncbi:MAG: MMPL family transporter, partial [Pseudomonadota bacterium]
MGRSYANIDSFATNFARQTIRFRWWVILGAILIAIGLGSGGRFLEFSNNYRVFFSDANPELSAFLDFQATYTKSDNILFVLNQRDGTAITKDTLVAVEELTEAAWQIPFSSRVDSITNFQHTYGVDDDLIVEDLIYNPGGMTDEEITARLDVAVAEPLLRNQLIHPERIATSVNVVLQYPELSLTEVPEAAAYARGLRADIEERYPQLQVSITGVSMLNNAFAEIGTQDLGVLLPIMFVIILGLTLAILRTPSGTGSTLMVIALSTMAAMGIAGFAGVSLTPVAAMAPVVILTLAVADSVHVLMSLRSAMRSGMNKEESIIESIRLNMVPVTVTSLTTIVGFLALNFSDSPPFWHLGNITATGIAAAWILSLTLLPAMLAIFPMKQLTPAEDSWGERQMSHLAEFVIARPVTLVASLGIISAVLIFMIPNLNLNDEWTKYFDHRTEFRRDTDVGLQYFGMYPVEYSVPADTIGGVSDPEFLARLDAFSEFLRAQPQVQHVYSLSDIMKRLNRNLHADDPAYYRIPEDRELAAQYLLLYELSLPYGLDLNDRINIDKSATRLTATLKDVDSVETKAFLAATREWMAENLPENGHAHPTGPQVMFTYIAERNVESMTLGTVIAILAISGILILTLRNLKLGILSLVPNGLPILTTFGTWTLLIGHVGFSVATIASISLGIIVDDTVHLLSKYVRAREERNASAADAIRYAFKTVGMALVVNTVVLTAGFLVLVVSAFKVNVDMGLLTAIAIVYALSLDVLILPGLLLLLDRDTTATDAAATTSNGGESMNISGQPAAIALALTATLALTVAPDTLAQTEPRGD